MAGITELERMHREFLAIQSKRMLREAGKTYAELKKSGDLSVGEIRAAFKQLRKFQDDPEKVKNFFTKYAKKGLSQQDQKFRKELLQLIERQNKQRAAEELIVKSKALVVKGAPSKLLQSYVASNLKLVKNVRKSFFGSVESVLVDAYKKGLRPSAIAKQIQARGEITERRAKLIARDQTSKLFGSLTEHRQTELGITHYIWRTSKDERVRTQHKKRANQVFAWAQPPVEDPTDGHPGHAINCRCSAEPVLPI